MQAFLVLLILVLLAASLYHWVSLVRHVSEGVPLVPLEPRQVAPWTGLDVVMALVILFGAYGFVHVIWEQFLGIRVGDPNLTDLKPTARATVLVMGSLAHLATFVLSLLFTAIRTNSTAADVGFDFSRLGYDMRLGLRMFVLVAPPIYLLQFVLHQWFPTVHPLIELIRAHPDPLFFAASGFSAVIVAPLAEEYLFRVLLQGWLQKLRWVWQSEPVKVINGSNKEAIATDNASESSVAMHVSELNPYSASQTKPDIDEVDSDSSAITAVPLWPILVSSLLFAAAHFSHGPDPIPLFFLAMAIGYLYRQTNRIAPCIVVHFCLNGLTMFALLVSVYFGE